MEDYSFIPIRQLMAVGLTFASLDSADTADDDPECRMRLGFDAA